MNATRPTLSARSMRGLQLRRQFAAEPPCPFLFVMEVDFSTASDGGGSMPNGKELAIG